MRNYNFDEVIERKGSGAIKVDLLKERFGKEDLIPMWVADMDFRTGEFITEALIKRCEHGIFGYTATPEEYYSSIIQWVEKRHEWKIDREWIEYIPGIVKGIAFCVMNFTSPEDKVIIQPPVYYPFRLVPEMHDRKIVNNPLKEENGVYKMDLDHLKSVIDKDCKMLILCNPHNPAGLTWDHETLKELAAICAEHKILVVSDEIHSDMALFGNQHIPFASVSEEAKNNSITFMAPSKTFNIAGIVSSFCVIPDQKIRKSFFKFLHSSELASPHLFATIASIAAYTKGEEWLEQMIQYIEKNILFVENFIQENIPSIKTIRPQASFLIWLDCRELNLTQEKLVSLFIDGAGLALNDGSTFGKEGKGFMRMNIGCPLSTIEKALNKLKNAVSDKI